MKVFNIIGFHNSGKTTAVENLIGFFRSKGQSVSTIKDIHQEHWTMEKAGSNSDRHLKASQSCVFARGLHETHLIWKRQLPLEEMLAHLNTEWVIIEGMSELSLPKIVVAKNESEAEQLITNTVFAITGPISESIAQFQNIPCINARTSIDQLGDLVLKVTSPFVETHACASSINEKITIKFNDQEIELNEWVQQVSSDVFTAFCQNLRGYQKGDQITIIINS